MKKIWFGAFVFLLSSSCISQKEIKVEEVRNNIGDTVKVCTKIFDARFEENAKGSPTTLYTSVDESNMLLTIIIWGDRRRFFDYKPEKDLKERQVCITGKVELLKDKPVIIVEKQSQIDIQ